MTQSKEEHPIKKPRNQWDKLLSDENIKRIHDDAEVSNRFELLINNDTYHNTIKRVMNKLKNGINSFLRYQANYQTSLNLQQ